MKRILLALAGLVILCLGAGIATYMYLSSYGRIPTGQIEIQPEYAFSVTGTGKSSLKGPLSAVSTGDRIFVADSTSRKIAIFDDNGTPVDSFRPMAEVESASPLMTAADEDGRVYVTVTVGAVHKIMVYDSRGSFLYAFPDGLTKSRSPLKKPVGLAAFRDKIYVTDIGDHDVKVFRLDGRLITRFGEKGHEPGEFSYPNGIAVDQAENIYVSDSNNARVEVFDRIGRYKYTFASSDGRLFSLPRGLAVDGLSRIHVVDVFSHKVLVFDGGGGFLFSYGNQGSGVEDFSYPNGITIDESGRIFIADRENNRIAVWQVK